MENNIDGDDKLIAAAQQIVKSLGTSRNLTNDMIMILSNFDNRFSNITQLFKSEIELKFDAAEKVVLRWESNSNSLRHNNNNNSLLRWEDSPEMSSEYLSAVDDILRLMGDPMMSSDEEIMERAESLLQQAMSMLEDEVSHILTRNTVPLDPQHLTQSIRNVSLSFSSKFSLTSTSNVSEIQDFDASLEEEHQNFSEEKGQGFEEDPRLNLINPNAVPDLKEIVDRMIRSGYEKECCQVYCSVRRDYLYECLAVLGVEKLSIEEVQKIEWRLLDDKMNKWIQAVKNVMTILLPGEKRLCDRVFACSELIRDVCFTEATKGCVMQLLNFGEAIIIGRRSPEKLFRILDMYDALSDVMPALQALFPNDSGEVVSSEAQGILDGLGESVRGSLVEFENAIKGETSRKTTQGGEIHPLTRYVMNYLKLLVDYSGSLNVLLKSSTDDRGCEGSHNSSNVGTLSPMGHCLLLLISSLESNLEEKSKFYEDGGMQYIFLMNNILYIIQKVKDSELGNLLGDHWVRQRRGQVRRYATSYLRASWSKALSFMKDEGMRGSGNSKNVSKVAIKERFKSFNSCFEEIYRTQSAWKVPDPQLREELRLSISEKVLPAYRSFMGRFESHLEHERRVGKYIKYTHEDLENYLLDLFEGSPRIMQSPRRKSIT